jgi:hypothetical protein
MTARDLKAAFNLGTSAMCEAEWFVAECGCRLCGSP